MITDSETNFLYLADFLKKEYFTFWEQLKKLLNDNEIPYAFLEGTKDIWCRDYMPIQIDNNNFIQFKYEPDYLRYDRLWKETIPHTGDYEKIYNSVKKINLQPKKSNLVVDGGNVIKGNGKVIMCDKVFKENEKEFNERELLNEFKKHFKDDKIIFVPWDECSDYTGHADGMIRLIGDNKVLINKYGKEDEEFKNYLMTALYNAGLEWEEIPYNPYKNESCEQAIGIYINYLQMKDIIIVPIFEGYEKENDKAVQVLKQYFKKVKTLECTDIAKDGGVLNCITWNILA